MPDVGPRALNQGHRLCHQICQGCFFADHRIWKNIRNFPWTKETVSIQLLSAEEKINNRSIHNLKGKDRSSQAWFARKNWFRREKEYSYLWHITCRKYWKVSGCVRGVLGVELNWGPNKHSTFLIPQREKINSRKTQKLPRRRKAKILRVKWRTKPEFPPTEKKRNIFITHRSKISWF